MIQLAESRWLAHPAAEVATTNSVLVTGATGTLGSLAAAALLRDENTRVVAPVRQHHPPGALLEIVGRELSFGEPPSDWQSRLHQVALPSGVDDPAIPSPLSELDSVVERFAVDEVIHAAGCLSYFDEQKLRAVNIEMTRRFVAAASRWGVNRFVHISTAFASGLVEGEIAETLHDDPVGDPTVYTQTKREGERIVAGGGVPFLIVRPSIVIGDSTTGRYHGPLYGVYQLLSGVERFLLERWSPAVHYVAPDSHAALLHQDSFQAGLMAARTSLPDDSIIHLTSRGGPGFADIVKLLADDYIRPEIAYFYDRMADIPMDDIPSAQRAFLRLASVNIEISSRSWDFATTTLDELVRDGADFVDTSIESVRRCITSYFRGSSQLAKYNQQFASSFPKESVIERL